MEIKKFKELFNPKEVKTCQVTTRKTWYNMPLEVFTSFIFKVSVFMSLFFYSTFAIVSLQFDHTFYFEMLIYLMDFMVFQQDIAIATNDGVQKYYEDTAKNEVKKKGVAMIM